MMAAVRALFPGAGLLLAVVGAFVLLSLGSFWLAVRPPRLAVPLSPDEYGLRPEAVTIAAADGVRLSGWFLPRPGAPAVVLLHGYPAEKADMLPLAAALHRHFATLLMDLRYFGQSEGGLSTLGLRERSDLRRTLDFLTQRGYGKVGVFGLSLGGAVAITTAAEDGRLRAVVAYAPFSDLRQLGLELYGWLGVFRYPLVELMTLWSRLLLGGDLTRPAPAEAARALMIPVLLIHSRGDDQIPFGHAERLREALGGNPRAAFYFPDRGGHNDLPSDFHARVTSFFLANL